MKFAPRLAAGLASGLATALLATGCDADNPKPAPLPSGSPSASATAPAFTPVPAAAKKKTAAGAKAFVDHFMVAMNEAAELGDTTQFRKLFTSECTPCVAAADVIDKVYSAGGVIRGGKWTVTQSRTYGFDGDRFPVDVVMRTARQTYKMSRTAPQKVARAESGIRHNFDVSWRSEHWIMTGLDAAQ